MDRTQNINLDEIEWPDVSDVPNSLRYKELFLLFKNKIIGAFFAVLLAVLFLKFHESGLWYGIYIALLMFFCAFIIPLDFFLNNKSLIYCILNGKVKASVVLGGKNNKYITGRVVVSVAVNDNGNYIYPVNAITYFSNFSSRKSKNYLLKENLLLVLCSCKHPKIVYPIHQRPKE
ncbi:MAG: hypothetical protein MK052_11445 [Alphaproteobacteria bacterium]|nr:hypothetical protein [Alphaproteobacteria bacterium]